MKKTNSKKASYECKNKEEKFVKNLKRKIKLNNKEYTVEIKKNLIYKVIIVNDSDDNNRLKYIPKNPEKPSRGVYAFQTDLLIKQKSTKLPLVIIEIKYGNFSSHDILSYSTKALKHKEIYPYVRYGFIVGGKNNIDNRFFKHNAGFDFAFAVKNQIDLENLNRIIKAQIESAESLLNIFVSKNKKIKSFCSTIQVG